MRYLCSRRNGKCNRNNAEKVYLDHKKIIAGNSFQTQGETYSSCMIHYEQVPTIIISCFQNYILTG